MKMQLSEIVDRYTILLLKEERTDLDITAEKKEYQKYVLHPTYGDIQLWIEKLKFINGKIWDLESDIRQGREDVLGLEEVGRRALMIRNFNNERIECKNEITLKYGEGYIEVKQDHASDIKE